MKLAKCCLFTGLCLLAAVSTAKETPEDFFYRYTQLGEEFDPAIAQLYANSAPVRVFFLQGPRPKGSLELAGWQWQRHIAKTWEYYRRTGFLWSDPYHMAAKQRRLVARPDLDAQFEQRLERRTKEERASERRALRAKKREIKKIRSHPYDKNFIFRKTKTEMTGCTSQEIHWDYNPN